MTSEPRRLIQRRTALAHGASCLGLWGAGCRDGGDTSPGEGDGDDAWHVHPGQSIQAALDRASSATDGRRRVVVHEGTYRP